MQYNYLGQPTVILQSGQIRYKHIYDANGNLHKTTSYDKLGNEHIKLYHGGIEYYDGHVESVYHSEGRYVFQRAEDNTLERSYHEFMIQDHLGNVRVRFADLNGDGKINIVDPGKGSGQEKELLGSYHFYPYGMPMNGLFHQQGLVANAYQYNGIDYLDLGDLNVNHATWRTLDPAIGRWWQSDPLTEVDRSFSPYNSMWASPMNFSDPDGDLPIDWGFLANFFDLYQYGWPLAEAVVTGAGSAANAAAFGSGFLSGLAGGALGAWNFVTHGAWQASTWQATGNLMLASALRNPLSMLEVDAALGTNTAGVTQAVVASVNNTIAQFQSGDPRAIGEASGQVAWGVLEVFAGAKGMGAISNAKALPKVAGASTAKFWTNSTSFRNIKVFQRDDLIKPSLTDAAGRTNLQRMQKGLAPIGPDGKSINLHHMTQTNSSSLAEMTQSFHQSNFKVIHINPNSIPSGVNRSEFNAFRRSYWKYRAGDFN